MTRRKFLASRTNLVHGLLILVPFVAVPGLVAAEPSPTAVSAFNSYVSSVESRIAQQHRSLSAFLALNTSDGQTEARLRRGDFIVEKLTPSVDPVSPGAMLHHWRGTAFAAGAKAADFERLMKDFNAYPHYFSPQVLKARVLARHDDRPQVLMRIRQHHVITVVMDTTYDITFGQLDPKHGYNLSRTTKISEIDSPGTDAERTLSSSEAHGFLWILNNYWSYEERDGGLYVQVESVSLTRSIPRGLGWLIGPFVESVPRESLEFTLHSTLNALRK